MRKTWVALAICMAFATTVFGQSSGNFTYGSNSQSERCVLNNNNTGSITGGQTCSLGAGPSCTLDTDCTAPAICFNPTGATGSGQCVDSTSGGSCTSDSQCTTPGQTCVIPAGAASGSCGAVLNGACIGGFTVGIKTSSHRQQEQHHHRNELSAGRSGCVGQGFTGERPAQPHSHPGIPGHLRLALYSDQQQPVQRAWEPLHHDNRLLHQLQREHRFRAQLRLDCFQSFVGPVQRHGQLDLVVGRFWSRKLHDLRGTG